MSGQSSEALEAMIEQGFGYLEEGRFEDAIEVFSAAHLLDGRDDRPLRGRALANVRIGHAVVAESDFRAARDLNSDSPDNWMGVGLSLAMQNKIYEAIAIYEELLHRKPDYLQAHIQLGRLYFKVGVIAKGRDFFQKALTLRPNLAQRREIETVLREQDKLDHNRYYRPDFGRLAREGTPLANLTGRIINFFKRG